MNKATISADIISSTSLNVEQRWILEKGLKDLLIELSDNFTPMFYGRLIKGDYIECVLEEPKIALRVALLLKAFIKKLPIEQANIKDKKFQDFKTYGIRVAIGVGNLSIWDKEKGIIDGEAIYFSGRAVNEMTIHEKIKNTLTFRSGNNNWNESFEPICELLDVIFSKMTASQSEIIYYKLLQKTEEEIKHIIGKTQSTINQHSRTAGWNAINSAVKYFEEVIH
ncbi:hypothetical protein M2138_001585 [Dysgonomonadaceae bacterium PH5-43]|nr:hypothetical protein [Dysgonomonadaceae bacterium PH5-43]